MKTRHCGNALGSFDSTGKVESQKVRTNRVAIDFRDWTLDFGRTL
jgi:hypothetical protein